MRTNALILLYGCRNVFLLSVQFQQFVMANFYFESSKKRSLSDSSSEDEAGVPTKVIYEPSQKLFKRTSDVNDGE